ncbi:hypothetical protein JCM21142_3970 [Saccharicrinis fermentans DSM 9555 = JCM 21142]|uniref:DUF1015 domain-containing protein n=1 Tax=Saccharicrinis fermentans DSM 9555 = JCM 21142 TaxID=869213 RepID=W7YD02_9BACT|nr:DUF1015 domain-containing protein [Saccharicrinis fermentans]GAF02336.1 hypothetical protein JCM21142_3970 [Saccharicrinis fermentans DSM 9555 = JCM 21142]
MVHVKINNANIEPVFFTYPNVQEIDDIVEYYVKNNTPEYDFVAEDGFGHHFWVIRNSATNQRIEELFATKVPATYVADGHHRTAAAALVGQEKRLQNPRHRGDENYNYFLAVHFPDNQLKIIDYNRVVKDLHGLSNQEFMARLRECFEISRASKAIIKPNKLHEFTMYLNGNWYKLNAKAGTYNDNDPLGFWMLPFFQNWY